MNPLFKLALLTDVAAAEEAPAFLAIAMQLLPMIAIIGVFYFILIRPQRKKDKAVKSMLSNLKVGDRVCSIGGIYGTVVGMKDDSVTVAVGAEKTKLIFARWGIKSVEDAPIENEAEPLV